MTPKEILDLDTSAVYQVARRTPLDYASHSSTETGNHVFLKREDLQPIFSFKLRGAYNKLAHLMTQQTVTGIVCASAGNHAQGVALAASQFSIPAMIVMPVTTPKIKIDAVVALGAEVIIHGESFDDAGTYAIQMANDNGYAFIHPFDDPWVIAGQSTIGEEILLQSENTPHCIFVPIGGGGLAAGVASIVKNKSPQTKVIGVEPEDSASMLAAIKNGAPVTLEEVGIFADGVAVKRVGDHTFALCNRYIDEVITVNTDQICASIKDLFMDTRVMCEPAGAVAMAGLRKYVTTHDLRDQRLVAISSGANLNFDRLLHVTERANIGAKTEALFAIEIPEEPGSFLSFCMAIGEHDITEFNYRFDNQRTAHIFTGIRLTRGDAEKAELLKILQDAGYNALDLSDNAVAKLHLRHLVGGSSSGLRNERLYRFQFPERPGALMKFLTAVGTIWNISLFHYRNHGSDFGRVLCGIQVPEEQLAEFAQHLNDLGYAHWDESDNPVYQLFLSSS